MNEDLHVTHPFIKFSNIFHIRNKKLKKLPPSITNKYKSSTRREQNGRRKRRNRVC
jgi:hypothetical protein